MNDVLQLYRINNLRNQGWDAGYLHKGLSSLWRGMLGSKTTQKLKRNSQVCLEIKHLVQPHWRMVSHSYWLCYPPLSQTWMVFYFIFQCSRDDLHKLMFFMNICQVINKNSLIYISKVVLNCMGILILCFNCYVCESPVWFRQWCCPAVGFGAYQAFVSLHPDEWLLPQFFDWKWSNIHADGDKKSALHCISAALIREHHEQAQTKCLADTLQGCRTDWMHFKDEGLQIITNDRAYLAGIKLNQNVRTEQADLLRWNK